MSMMVIKRKPQQQTKTSCCKNMTLNKTLPSTSVCTLTTMVLLNSCQPFISWMPKFAPRIPSKFSKWSNTSCQTRNKKWWSTIKMIKLHSQGILASTITSRYTNRRMLYYSWWKQITFTFLLRSRWQSWTLIRLRLSFQPTDSSLRSSVRDWIFCKFTKHHQKTLKTFLISFPKTSTLNNSKSLSKSKDVNTWSLIGKIQNTW